MEGDRPTVPPLLDEAAAVFWRLLVVTAGVAGILWIAAKLSLVVLPLLAALLLSALLMPLAAGFRRLGMGRGASSAVTLVLFLLVLALAIWFVAVRVASQLPELVGQF